MADDSEVYHVLDTTLIPAIARVRACRKGLFAGQATFGRCVSKTEWIYGFKVALSVSPAGVIMAFGLAEANSDERPVGEFLVAADGHDAFLADKGVTLLQSGRSIGWRSTGPWLLLLHRRALEGHGRRRHDDGQQERGNSSRGS